MFGIKHFKKKCRASAFFCLDGTADLLAAISTVSHVFSGIAFVASDYLDKGLQLDYYANASAFGSARELNVLRPYQLEYQDKLTGKLTFSLEDYFSVDLFRLCSVGAFIFGLSMNMGSQFFQIYSQSQKDKKRLRQDHYLNPSRIECSHQLLHGALSGFATMAFSASFGGFAMYFQDLFSLGWQYAYPKEGTQLVDGEGQNRTMEVIQYEVSHWVNFPYHHLDHIVNISFSIQGKSILAYGVTLARSAEKDSQDAWKGLSFALGGVCLSIASYSAGRFFKTKAIHHRLERLRQIVAQDSFNENSPETPDTPSVMVINL